VLEPVWVQRGDDLVNFGDAGQAPVQQSVDIYERELNALTSNGAQTLG